MLDQAGATESGLDLHQDRPQLLLGIEGLAALEIGMKLPVRQQIDVAAQGRREGRVDVNAEATMPGRFQSDPSGVHGALLPVVHYRVIREGRREGLARRRLAAI